MPRLPISDQLKSSTRMEKTNYYNTEVRLNSSLQNASRVEREPNIIQAEKQMFGHLDYASTHLHSTICLLSWDKGQIRGMHTQAWMILISINNDIEM